MQQQFLYWFPEAEFEGARALLKKEGFRVSAAMLTPCQVMKAEGNRVVYAPPDVWPRICTRQSTWYRTSRRAGQFMLMSARRLPQALDVFLDAEIEATDFKPDRLPSEAELEAVVRADAYQKRKPPGWEAIGLKDAWLFKALFSITGFWRRRSDNLKRHWLGQRANHANFLARRFTTKWDGEDVAYSVTENASVCSSCVEFFNVVDDRARKLVRSCPGSVIFGSAPRNVFLDVKPIQIGVHRERVAS